MLGGIPMATILHVTTLREWESAKIRGAYESNGFAQEGFLHCCTSVQLAGVLERYFTPRPEGLVVLKIEEERVHAGIRYEGEAGPFPHIYGRLNLDSVTEVEPLSDRIRSC